MNDIRMEGHAKELPREISPTAEWMMELSGAARPQPRPADPQTGGDVERQALQMLALAQRTAEEHVANAHGQADKIDAEARAAAEQIVKDAQAQADASRRDADKALADARAEATRIARDAEAHAARARRNGDSMVADAQARAAEIAKDAQASADKVKRQAQLRYEEMVGDLAAKREALQQQIKALQEFDRDYRARLLTFMQGQLRSLWVDEAQIDSGTTGQDTGTQGHPDGGTPSRLPAAHRPDSEAITGSLPVRTRPSDHA